MGRTSLCPDRCGESGNLATFRVLQYLEYRKPGEYGDPQADRFSFLVDDTLGRLHIPAAFADIVRALKPGDRVHLVWQHDYVTRTENGGTAKFPERPLTLIEPAAPDKTATGQPTPPPAPAARPALTLTGTIPADLASFTGVAHAMIYAYDPRLADVPATLLAESTVPVSHTQGKADPVRMEFPALAPVPDRQHYARIDVYADAARTRRVMGTGDFCKIFEPGAGDTAQVPLVPAN